MWNWSSEESVKGFPCVLALLGSKKHVEVLSTRTGKGAQKPGERKGGPHLAALILTCCGGRRWSGNPP